MIPVEVGKPSFRRQMFDIDLNQESLMTNMDVINEYKDRSKIREETCKIRATRRYNSKVKPICFKRGDIVWK